MTKITLALICLTTSYGFAAHAATGPGSTGGGKSVVCRAPDHSIQSAELLDLYEARIIYGRTIPVSSDSVDQQIASNFPHLTGMSNGFIEIQDNLAALIEEKARVIFSNMKFLDGVVLQPTDDSFENVVPENCAVEQTIIYTGQDQILVNNEIWTHLNSTNQAAALLHESLYKDLRSSDLDTNSIRTRRIVGYIFSGQKFTDLTKLIPHDSNGIHYLDCKATNSSGQMTEMAAFDLKDHLEFLPMWQNGKEILGQKVLLDGSTTSGFPQDLAQLEGPLPVTYTHDYNNGYYIDSEIEDDLVMNFTQSVRPDGVHFILDNLPASCMAMTIRPPLGK